MDLPLEHLRTLATVVDAGSLEAAAQQLHVSPSAVSQRLRSLEERVGVVLLRRSRPVAVTEAGTPILRAARQLAHIVDGVAAELSEHTGAGSGSVVRLVINADSLATWFVPALARAARETGARFEVLRADETVSAEKLRSGEVMAALTSTSAPVPGCQSSLVGIDRYHAVCAPEFFARHFAGGVAGGSLTLAPTVQFDREDTFQFRFLREFAAAGSPTGTTGTMGAPAGTDAAHAESAGAGPEHQAAAPPQVFIPSSTEFAQAVELGMGWGMLPWRQCEAPLAAGRLVELVPGRSLDLPLYWQRWDLRSPVLDALSRIVTEEARAALSW